MVAVRNIERDSTFAWSNNKQPRLALGSVSGKIDANFSNDSKLEIWDCFKSPDTPLQSIEASSKFMDLAWSKDDSVIVGGLDNGVVEFYSAPKEQNEEIKVLTSIKAHNASVQALAFSKVKENQLATGDATGLINIWDINSCTKDANYKPETAGQAITNVDNIKSIAWNNRIGHILASAGSSSGFTSIWDLNQRKEILHIGYTNPETNQKVPFDVVQWHPTSGTVIATASNSDLHPAIVLWDLRKANTPLDILKEGGHSKGVLSLDWCSKDAGLLLSSSSDNTVCLWDPETTKSLLQVYPPRSNWVFKAKFAPELPDYFASASHDSSIEIQQLQDLQIDPLVVKILENENNDELTEGKDEQITEQNDDDFWNSLSKNNNADSATKIAGNSTKTLKKVNQSKNVSLHVPKWISQSRNANPAASWAFGGKMVKINKDGKSVSVLTQPKSTVSSTDVQKQYDLLQSALKKKDFNAIISKRVNSAINENNEDDWGLLDKISLDGKEVFFKETLALDDTELEEKDEEKLEGEEFFEKLEQEQFNVSSITSNYEFSSDETFKSLVNKDLKKATDLKLENDDILTALVIANISKNEDLKEKVINEFFFKNASKSPSARLLFALSQGKIEDLIEKSDVSNWKYVSKAIKNYVSDDSKKTSLYTLLGEKLYKAGRRQDALVLFMSFGILDKVSEIWVDELKEIEDKLRTSSNSAYEAHLTCLTEFVERFSCFANFFEANNNKLITGNTKIVSIILEFVNTICINGNFNLALDFLNILPSDNSDVATEKQRVLIASGKSATVATNNTSNQQKYGRQSVINGMNTVPMGTASSINQNGSILQPKPQLYASQSAIPKAVSPVPIGSRQGSVYAPKSAPLNNSIYAAIPQPKTEHAKAAVYAPPQIPTPAASSPFSNPIPPPATTTAKTGYPQAIPSIPQLNNPYKPKATIVSPPVATTPHTYQNNLPTPAIPTPSVPTNQVRGVVQPQIITSPQKTEEQESTNNSQASLVSGQKPVGNIHANAGWNDFALPIPGKVSRAKPIGVKKESVVSSPAAPLTPQPFPTNSTPNNHSYNPQQSPQIPSKSVLPPPPIASRTSSNKNLTDLQAASKKRVVSEKSTKYAPTLTSTPSSVNGGNSTIPLQPPIKENNHAAVPPPPAFNNPYAPPKQTGPPSGKKFTPPQPPLVKSSSNGNLTPSITTPTTILPPPIKRKSTVDSSSPTVPPTVKEVEEKIEEKIPPAESTMLMNEEKENNQEEEEEETEEKKSVFSKEEAVKIQTYFNDRMKIVTENLPEKFAAQVKDTQKRITILSNHLKKRDLIKNREVITKLLGILDALDQNIFDEAKKLQSEIASDYPEEAGKWLTGVKRFIGFAEVYESKK